MDAATFAAVVVMLAPKNPGDREIEISILKGRDCAVVEASLDSCASKVAAELMIDGKVIGSIPLDALSESEVKQLVGMLDGYGMVSKRAIAAAQKAAREAEDMMK